MKFEQCAKKLLIKEPFYGIFLLSLNKQFTTEIPTLGVCLEGINHKILINEEYWNSLTDDQQIDVLKHELMHICFKHTTQLYKDLPNHKMANIAMDCEVNQLLENLPEGCVDYKKLKTQFPDLEEKAGSRWYYKYFSNIINDTEVHGGRGQGQGQGEDDDNDGDGDPEGFGKDDKKGSHDKWKDFDELSDAEKELVEQQTDYVVKNTAEQVTKMRGTIPAEFKEYIDSLFVQKPAVFNWKAYFRRLLGIAIDTAVKPTRKRPSKRFEDAPGLRHKQKHSILVGIDTSGSVSEQELLDFFSEINHVYKTGANVDIVECDAAIHRIYPYKGKFDGSITGRGGTSFDPVIEYYNQHQKQYSTLVYFTDGECCINTKPKKNMIWVITSNGYRQDYPGKALYIPAEH